MFVIHVIFAIVCLAVAAFDEPSTGDGTVCFVILATQSQALGRWGYSFADLRVAEWAGGRRVRLVDLNGENAL